jgi:hypothetical protein
MARMIIGLCLALGACQVSSGETTAKAERADVVKSDVVKSDARTSAPAALAQAGVKPEAAAADPCLDERNPKFDPDKCVEPEVRVDAYVGTWRVTNVAVASDGVQAFGKDDPAIVGSEFKINAQEIRWTKPASDGFTADDVCTLPSASPMPPIVEKEEGGSLVAAVRSLAIKGRGTLHRFGCATSGRWGPGEVGNALFIPIGPNQMLLQWYDGVSLLAKRGT